MIPSRATIGRFFVDAEGRLWLHEYADASIVSLIDGYYKPLTGEFQRPERKLLVAGEAEPGLRLLDEPIQETLAQLHNERQAA